MDDRDRVMDPELRLLQGVSSLQTGSAQVKVKEDQALQERRNRTCLNFSLTFL